MIWLKENNTITNNKIIIEKEKLKELNDYFKSTERDFGTATTVYQYKIPELFKGFYFYDKDFQKILYYCDAPQCYYITRTLLENKETNINLIFLLRGLISTLPTIKNLVEALDKDSLKSILMDLSSDLYYFSNILLSEMKFEKNEELNISEIDLLKTKSKTLTLAEENSNMLSLSRKIHDKFNA